MKTNVIFFGNCSMCAVNRKFVNTTGGSKDISSGSYITKSHVSKTDKEKNNKIFNFFKKEIDSNESNIALHFDSKETLELFDTNNYLRDRAYIFEEIEDEFLAMDIAQLFALINKITGFAYASKEEKANFKKEYLDRFIYLIDSNGQRYLISKDIIYNNSLTLSICPVIEDDIDKERFLTVGELDNFLDKKIDCRDKNISSFKIIAENDKGEQFYLEDLVSAPFAPMPFPEPTFNIFKK